MTGETARPGILGLWAGWTPGTDGYGDTVDENFIKLSALAQLSVLSRTTVQPVSGSDGDIYILKDDDGANPNKVAVYTTADDWVYYAPAEGMVAYIQDDEEFVFWDGTAWTGILVAGSTGRDLAVFYPDTPVADEVVFSTISRRAWSIPASGHKGEALTAATAETVIELQKNGVAILTFTFAASGTTATITGSGGSLAVDDVLSIVDTSGDDTIAGLMFSVLMNEA